MIRVLEHHNLRPLTSMYLGGKARYFSEVFSQDELKEALLFAKKKELRVFILGGGSNIIVSDSGFDGLVIKISISGIKLIHEDETSVTFEVGAGENWDNFVSFVVIEGLYGLENLSHIPGTVGASVVQNIGAYGAEVSTSVISVKVLDRDTLQEKILLKENLGFSYRKSCLNDKSQNKDRYVVIGVTFCLYKTGELNEKYDDIKKYFIKHPEKQPTLQSVREAVISIRDGKFPFPNSPMSGTVGSFWNAQPVDEETYTTIINKLQNRGFKEKADDMIRKKSAFTVAQGLKVVPGLFIEILGLKGKVLGGAKILETHAGVINNFSGEATTKDVMDLSNLVVTSLKREFNIDVKIEPELVGEF